MGGLVFWAGHHGRIGRCAIFKDLAEARNGLGLTGGQQAQARAFCRYCLSAIARGGDMAYRRAT
jgi:hypothetical protein